VFSKSGREEKDFSCIGYVFMERIQAIIIYMGKLMFFPKTIIKGRGKWFPVLIPVTSGFLLY
jgi:hypothetical protein